MTFLHYIALNVVTLIVGVLTVNTYKVIANPSNLSQEFVSSVTNLSASQSLGKHHQDPGEITHKQNRPSKQHKPNQSGKAFGKHVK